ncbi:HAD family acid phosphatase [Bradyrhizobium jicamae]|uniref:HAD family acid phosphatase n=1 Tax=Bradyrhizobium jicamae TaxID=280332 RepID=UPI001BA706D3|nr:HAD family acid phosphatase [Bradyrhizobium jicamae]MBR0936213.1 HAD family acid phosphatase [Bradyrhizobium jicamae]
MTCWASRRSRLVAAAVVAMLAIAPCAAIADECPAMPPNHIPDAPPPPLNIDNVKARLTDYHDNFYLADVAAVFGVAQMFIDSYSGQAQSPAIVFDIDETSLTNWPNLAADNFGFIAGGACDVLPAGPCGFNKWIAMASAEPLPGAVDLFKAAKRKRIAVIFITGRHDSQRDATVINLDHAGYAWTELHTRPDRDEFPTVQAFKTSERAKVAAEGYTIIANIGDQMSDIDGNNSGCRFKVPNPFYFIK